MRSFTDDLSNAGEMPETPWGKMRWGAEVGCLSESTASSGPSDWAAAVDNTRARTKAITMEGVDVAQLPLILCAELGMSLHNRKRLKCIVSPDDCNALSAGLLEV